MLKIVIPCAGSGTRTLPATFGMSKELLPIPFEGCLVKMLSLQLIKLQRSGIDPENICVVVSEGKEDIEKYLKSPATEAISVLKKKGLQKEARTLTLSSSFGRVKVAYQKCDHYGNAAPLLTKEVQDFIGDSDFMYLFPDDTFGFPKGAPDEIERVIKYYNQSKTSVLMGKKVEDPVEYDKYGIFNGDVILRSPIVVNCRSIDEKPGSLAKSDYASVSGFVFQNKILEYLNRQADIFDGIGEIMIQPAIQAMMNHGLPVHAIIIDGSYIDTGNHDSYINAMAVMGEYSKKF